MQTPALRGQRSGRRRPGYASGRRAGGAARRGRCTARRPGRGRTRRRAAVGAGASATTGATTVAGLGALGVLGDQSDRGPAGRRRPPPGRRRPPRGRAPWPCRRARRTRRRSRWPGMRVDEPGHPSRRRILHVAVVAHVGPRRLRSWLRARRRRRRRRGRGAAAPRSSRDTTARSLGRCVLWRPASATRRRMALTKPWARFGAARHGRAHRGVRRHVRRSAAGTRRGEAPLATAGSTSRCRCGANCGVEGAAHPRGAVDELGDEAPVALVEPGPFEHRRQRRGWRTPRRCRCGRARHGRRRASATSLGGSRAETASPTPRAPVGGAHAPLAFGLHFERFECAVVDSRGAPDDQPLAVDGGPGAAEPRARARVLPAAATCRAAVRRE